MSERITEFVEVSTPIKKTYCQKLKKIIEIITVEPIVILYFLASLMNNLTNQNLNLEKACRVDLRYNSSICDAMVNRDISGYSRLQEVEVQTLVSKMGAIRSIFIGIFPVILLLFVGSWSDRQSKRKPLILVPIICDIVGCVCLFFCSYFFVELPVIYSTLGEAIPFATGGAYCCFFLGIFSYVSDNCKVTQRTARIGAVTILQGVSMTSGTAIAGVLIKPIGYTRIYAITFVMMLVALLYGAIRLKDKKKPADHDIKSNFMRDFFDIQHIKSTLNVCFRNGPANRRSKMLLMMILTLLMFGAASGEHSLTYLYTRIKFGWDEKMFSAYNMFHFIIQMIGAFSALTVLSKYFGMPDAVLGIVSVICKIMASLLFATALTGRVFWIGALVEIFHGTGTIALRSIMSKIVPSHELGQSNSLFGLCEALLPLIFVPAYSFVYSSTMKIFLGTHYLMSSLIFVVSFGLFYWLYVIDEKNKTKEIETFEEENMEKLLAREKMVEMEQMNRKLSI